MASRFSRNFSLTDIFNNKALRGKIPLINYKEIETYDGRPAVRTALKSVNRFVYDTAKSAARPYYKPLVATQSGDRLILGGELVGEQDAVVDAVYAAILAQKSIISMTANNAYIIRDALKEAEKNKRQYGIDSKLLLRAQSMQQIEGMTKRQIAALINDIMENILYGDNFPKTQKKWAVTEMKVESPYNYEQRKERWKRKVGDL